MPDSVTFLTRLQRGRGREREREGEKERSGGGGVGGLCTRTNISRALVTGVYLRFISPVWLLGGSQGLSLLPVSTEEEAMRMLRIGQTAREVGENQFNHASSRQEIESSSCAHK